MTRIAFLDDDRSIRDTFLNVDSLGIHAEVFSDEEALLRFLNLHTVDHVVCDFQMPGRNGVEVLETIRTQFPNLNLILLTGRVPGYEMEVRAERIHAAVFKKPNLMDFLDFISDQPSISEKSLGFQETPAHQLLVKQEKIERAQYLVRFFAQDLIDDIAALEGSGRGTLFGSTNLEPDQLLQDISDLNERGMRLLESWRRVDRDLKRRANERAKKKRGLF